MAAGSGPPSSSIVGRVIRGGFWLYGRSLVNNLLGFLYWMSISAIAGPGVLGVVSAIAGFSGLIAGLLRFGTGVGVQRFIGLSLGKGSRREASAYLWSTSLFLISVLLPASLLLVVLSRLHIQILGFSQEMLEMSAVITLLSSGAVLEAGLISILRTDVLFASSLTGGVLKLLVGVSLVLLGWGWLGAAIGYVTSFLVSLAFGLLFSVKELSVEISSPLSRILEVVRAGLATWIPGTVALLGQWLGVLVVFGTTGAVETGHYYVAFAIASVILVISRSMLSLLLPVLSGMSDGRKRAGWRVLKLSLAMMTPVAVFIVAYPSLLLGLLGRGYVTASNMLVILVIASVPIAITVDITSLVYAYGSYLKVLTVGLAQNIPRIILYLTLTPLYGGLGAAIAYLIGSTSGLGAAIAIARSVGFKLGWREIGLIVAIPSAVGLVSRALTLHWAVSGTLILVASVLGYARTRIVTRSDLKELASALLPREVAERIYPAAKQILEWLYGEA